jgi:hypothetical protein
MNAMPSVTFETKCWEQDWEFLLKTGRLEQMIARNCHAFAQRVLVINNVSDLPAVTGHAQRAIDRGLLTRFHVAADHEADALRFFELTRDALGEGYIYSVAELVGLYLCQTDFLLHFSSDSILRAPVDWLTPTIHVFRMTPRVRVANPMWHDTFPREESIAELDFYFGSAFSDQCYLVRTSDLRAPIYNETFDLRRNYPAYAGNLFEKRVDKWMMAHGYLRLTYKHARYDHENIRRGGATIGRTT